MACYQSEKNQPKRPTTRKRAPLTSGGSASIASDGSGIETRRPSRDCMNESRLNPALLGDGLGGTLFLSLSLRPFLSLLFCRLFLSITISILSIWRCGTGDSTGSALTGVTGVVSCCCWGAGLSLFVGAFATEFERDRDRVRVEPNNVDPGSLNSRVKTRNELASSAVKN